MAERLKENQIDETGVNPFNAPIPGESLTDSPDTPKAWERPPEYTDEEEAMRAVYMVLTEQESLRGLIKIISEGTPLDEIAQVVLYKGYTEGQYNPDLMLLLAEPTIYLLIAIADYAEIKDYVLYDGEDDDPDAMLPEDDITPVDIDGDDEPDKPEVQAKPSKEGISDSLLARIEKDLPSKVEEVINVKEEEKEEVE
jgi:hypothetical protein